MLLRDNRRDRSVFRRKQQSFLPRRSKNDFISICSKHHLIMSGKYKLPKQTRCAVLCYIRDNPSSADITFDQHCNRYPSVFGERKDKFRNQVKQFKYDICRRYRNYPAKFATLLEDYNLSEDHPIKDRAAQREEDESSTNSSNSAASFKTEMTEFFSESPSNKLQTSSESSKTHCKYM